MMYLDYPQPVSILEEDGMVLLHRRVSCEHVDTVHCPCVPWRYSKQDLFSEQALALMNARLHQELQ